MILVDSRNWLLNSSGTAQRGDESFKDRKTNRKCNPLMDRKVVEASAQPVVPAQIAEAKIQQGGQNFKAKISNEDPPEAAPHPRTHSAPGHTCQAKAVPPRRISWLPLHAKLVCRILRETETEET